MSTPVCCKLVESSIDQPTVSLEVGWPTNVHLGHYVCKCWISSAACRPLRLRLSAGRQVDTCFTDQLLLLYGRLTEEIFRLVGSTL